MIGAMAQAASIGEMASMQPIAGAQYHVSSIDHDCAVYIWYCVCSLTRISLLRIVDLASCAA